MPISWQALQSRVAIVSFDFVYLFVALARNVSVSDSVLFNGPRAAINLNDGFGGGHSIEGSVIFNWVRETQDHGPINTVRARESWGSRKWVSRSHICFARALSSPKWDRQKYYQPASGNATFTPRWTSISHNVIMNGPSGNRDLGNLFPAVDNDDGSQEYWISRNVMVYGGTKNYLGENKVWDSNLIVAPERWSGDTCLCAWAGRLHVYSNNTCVRVSDDSPMYYDASVGGAECALDFSNATLAEWVPELHSNTYHTASGALTVGCGGDQPSYSLADLQSLGVEAGSRAIAGYDLDAIVGRARALAGL